MVMVARLKFNEKKKTITIIVEIKAQTKRILISHFEKFQNKTLKQFTTK